MANQSPNNQRGANTSGGQGTNAPGSKDNRNDQMEQSGRQNQPGGSQRTDQPRDSNPGSNQDKDRDQKR